MTLDPLNLKHLHDDGFASRRDALKLQDNPFNGVAAEQGRPMSDPLSNAGLFTKSLTQGGTLVEGVIMDSSSLANVYKIFLPGGQTPAVGFLLSHSSSSAYGAKDLATLSPGTAVLCVRLRSMNELCIIGVLPPPGGSPHSTLQGILHGATRQRVDSCHKVPIELSQDSQVKSFLNRRLFDSIGGGEAGWITETGMRIFIDPFMAMIGLDEFSGLSFFHFDKLVRLNAQQWQLWTGVSETEAFNDQGELSHWTGYAQYAWEQLGRTKAESVAKVKTAAEWQQSSPTSGKVDLLLADARPHHREVEWHGYLGQGGKRVVMGPPQSNTLYSASAIPKDNSGFADHFITLDGQVCWQSTRGFSMVKQSIIVVPTRTAKPEARTGDNETNYRFYGTNGAGEAHQVKGDVKSQDEGKMAAASRVAGSLDRHAYLFNMKGIHPFVYHSKDYSVPEVSTFEPLSIVPKYEELQTQQQLDPTAYKADVQIDHRYNTQPVYNLPAGFDILPDGSVVFFDGSGGEIKLTQGEMHITAPGGIFLKSGKTITMMAGDDMILKARNSMDITTTHKDIRIKAQNNLAVLAGVNETGGILVESRSVGSKLSVLPGEDMVHQGIIFKSPAGSITTIGSDIYQRTTKGDIIFDANKGQGSMINYVSQITNFAKQGERWFFNVEDDSVSQPAAILDSTQLVIPGGLFVKGESMLGGVVNIGNALYVGGIVAGYQFVGSSTSIGAEVASQNSERQSSAKSAGQSTYTSSLKEAFYDDDLRGADNTIEDLGFCYRTDEQYGTGEDFYMFEDRWQQLARLTSQDLPKWEEKPITLQDEEYYPFPGKAAYVGTGYKQQEVTMIQVETCTPIDRRTKDDQGKPIPLDNVDKDGKSTEAYIKAEHGPIKPVSFNSYTVIAK